MVDHFGDGSDLLTSHRFRSCICALILDTELEGGGGPMDAENWVYPSLYANHDCFCLILLLDVLGS